MVALARSALDTGVTFFDTAEAYGPFISEEILGEAFEGMRNKVVIATKFGWNIDQETGKSLEGLNSQPEHIKRVVEGMLSVCAQIVSICSTSIGSIQMFRSKTSPERLKILSTMARSCISDCPNPASRRSVAHTPSIPLQRFKTNIRCSGAGRKEVLPVCEELGIGFCAGVRLAWASSPAPSTRIHDSPTTGHSTPRYSPENSESECRARRFGEELGRAQKSPRRSFRWPGCWRRSRGSCRFRARPNCDTSSRTMVLRQCGSRRPNCVN